MKIKIPETVKVGGHIYTIDVADGFEDRTDCNAITLSDYLKIKLDKKSACPRRIEQVFIHELLHAIDFVYNANSLSEETVLRLGQGVYQVLVDNTIVGENETV